MFYLSLIIFTIQTWPCPLSSLPSQGKSPSTNPLLSLAKPPEKNISAQTVDRNIFWKTILLCEIFNCGFVGYLFHHVRNLAFCCRQDVESTTGKSKQRMKQERFDFKIPKYHIVDFKISLNGKTHLTRRMLVGLTLLLKVSLRRCQR